MHKVLEFVSTVHDLCAVLGMDFFSTVTEVHPSLNDSTSVQSKSISNDTLSRLAKTVLALKEDKKQRLHKVTCLESLSLSLSLSVLYIFSLWFSLLLLGDAAHSHICYQMSQVLENSTDSNTYIFYIDFCALGKIFLIYKICTYSAKKEA